MNKHRLGLAIEVPEGASRAYRIGSREIAVFNVEGNLHALENTCGRGLPLDRALIVDGEVLCPWHGWKLDLREGRCSVVPNHRTPVVAVRVEDGELWVEIEDAPPAST